MPGEVDIRQAIPAAALILRSRKKYAERIAATEAERAKARDMDVADWLESNFYVARNQQIQLALHQKGILRYALQRDDGGKFRFSTDLYGTVKKSGKSTIAAGVAKWVAETQTWSGEIYAVGNDFKQARERSFKELRRSIEYTPGYLPGRRILPGRWEVTTANIRCLPTGSKIEALATDSRGEAGGHPDLSIWCVTGETEVLCRNGWKRADMLTTEDEVAALVPLTGKMRWERPRAVNVTPYTGPMIRFKHRRAEFTVTPNHRIWGRFITHSRYAKQARDRGWWFEEARDAAQMAGGWLKGDADWEPENDYSEATARFLGYYIAEGHLSGNTIIVSQSPTIHPETYERIRQAFIDFGLTPTCTPTGVRATDRAVAGQLRPLGKSYDKFIPPHLKNGPTRALRAFFDAYIEGDGWRVGAEGSCQASTVSPRLADDLMEVALKIGYHPRFMGRRLRAPTPQPSGKGMITPRHEEIRLSFSLGPIYWERGYNGKRTGRWDEVEYSGLVACPSLEHGVFYIRSGGKCSWTGNTELWGYEHEESIRFWDELTRDPTRPDSVRWVETYAGYDGESPLLWGLYTAVVLNGRRLTNGEFAEAVARDRPGESYDDFLHAFVETQGDPKAPIPIYVNEDGGIFGYWDEGLEARRMPWQRGEEGERYYREEEATLMPRANRRFHWNEWVSAESSFVPIELFDACFDPDLPDVSGNEDGKRGEPMVIGVDAAATGDCFAVVGVTRHPRDKTRPAIRKTKIWSPDDFPDKRIHFEEAEAWLRAVCKSFNVVQIAYDPYQLEDMMQRLKRERVAWCEEFNQGTPRLEADRALYDSIVQGTLAHANPPDLRQHILNANAKVQKDEDSKLRIVKKAQNRKIDLAVAASMACARVMYLNL